jgi:hypothetical protein
MMPMRMRLFSITLLSVLGIALPLTANAAFKCWTNSDGVRECGNAIPPEYAQKGSETLNDQGMVVDKQRRAKTKAELAEERRRKEAEAKRQAEEKRRREEQAAYDRVLLATFTSVEDIVTARDRKLASIKGMMELSQATAENLQKKLAEYQKRAANIERRGASVPDDLLQDMENIKQQIAHKEDYLASKKEEAEALREKYARDIARFKELQARNH